MAARDGEIRGGSSNWSSHKRLWVLLSYHRFDLRLRFNYACLHTYILPFYRKCDTERKVNPPSYSPVFAPRACCAGDLCCDQQFSLGVSGLSQPENGCLSFVTPRRLLERVRASL